MFRGIKTKRGMNKMNMYNEKECYILAKLEAKRIKHMYYHAKSKFRHYFRDYYKVTDNGFLRCSHSNAIVENVANYFIDTNKNELSFVYNNLIGRVKLTPSICEKICEVMKCD
jgi:hypothetical protein